MDKGALLLVVSYYCYEIQFLKRNITESYLLVVTKYDTTTNRNGDTEYVPDMGIELLCPAIF